MACVCGEEECEFRQPEIDNTYGKSPGQEAIEEVRALQAMERKYLLDAICTFGADALHRDARWEHVRRKWASKHDRRIPFLLGGY